MPAQSVDPGIDEEREHKEVEGTTHEHADEKGQHELEPVHRATEGLTARTYPVGGTGSRCGSDQRAVMARSVRAVGDDSYSAVWAIPDDPRLLGRAPDFRVAVGWTP